MFCTLFWDANRHPSFRVAVDEMSSSTAKSGVSHVSRSVYVAQLRRSFLMRAHPDRFRSLGDESLRRGQAALLAALSERWNAQDFQNYTANLPSSETIANYNMAMARSSFAKQGNSPLPFVLEKRDGSLLMQSIRLDDTVENILTNLAKALELSGAASLPGPPPPAPQAEHTRGLDANQILWADAAAANSFPGNQYASYDVNSQKGRALLSFLKATPKEQVEQRKSFRMDASAAALVARRLYSFQAIDGINMGWSSESFAILLRSLIALHEEHSSRFHVDSFYPLRLVFSHDDFQSPLDLYGGILYLHPAATQIQTLETLQAVTPEKLQEFRSNRDLLHERTVQIQNTLGVKVVKGHSCSSMEYHKFIQQVAHEVMVEGEEIGQEGIVAASSALDLERVKVVVESPTAVRRPRATKEGSIQAHAQMTLAEMRSAKARLSQTARKTLQDHKEAERQCKEAIEQLQWAMGIQNVTRRGIVSHDEFLVSLARLMDQRDQFRSWLAGCSLGISGGAHFCHLADDGSIVIPHNWT